MQETGVRTPAFVARPARAGPVSATIHGKTYYQYDFTDEQYRALAKLTAALSNVLPRIEVRVPRDDSGRVLHSVLDADRLAAFGGIVAHWHLTERKIDPGPALDWDRLLHEARTSR